MCKNIYPKCNREFVIEVLVVYYLCNQNRYYTADYFLEMKDAPGQIYRIVDRYERGVYRKTY